jgi:hypothetical protein
VSTRRVRRLRWPRPGTDASAQSLSHVAQRQRRSTRVGGDRVPAAGSPIGVRLRLAAADDAFNRDPSEYLNRAGPTIHGYFPSLLNCWIHGTDDAEAPVMLRYANPLARGRCSGGPCSSASQAACHANQQHTGKQTGGRPARREPWCSHCAAPVRRFRRKRASASVRAEIRAGIGLAGRRSRPAIRAQGIQRSSGVHGLFMLGDLSTVRDGSDSQTARSGRLEVLAAPQKNPDKLKLEKVSESRLK